MWSTGADPSRDVTIAVEDAVAGRGVWHIPRPSLWSEPPHWSGHPPGRCSASSQASSTSNASTQSGASGSLLLTAANLAALRVEQSTLAPKPADTMSVASSTHFTVVNGVGRRHTKPLPSCCWHSHQLTALVVAMSLIFLVALLLAVLCLEMRWRDIRFFE